MHQMRPSCSACAYWVMDHTATPPTSGHCHRYPPGIYIDPRSSVVVQKFPTTDHHQWCGEWDGDQTRLAEAAKNSVLRAATHT